MFLVAGGFCRVPQRLEGFSTFAGAVPTLLFLSWFILLSSNDAHLKYSLAREQAKVLGDPGSIQKLSARA